MVLAETPSPADRLVATRTIGDAGLDLAATALDIANLALPDKSTEPYMRHLDMVCRDVSQFAGPHATARTAADALGHIIGRRYGYGGTEETFDNPDAANLMIVIDERCGLPVALGILYIHVARAQGWGACGIDFPGRFMVRIDVEGERIMLDPFGGGHIVRTRDLRDVLKRIMGADAELSPEHYAELNNRGVLMRLENNLKVRHLHAGRFDAALKAVETMLLLAPDNAALWREAGMIHVRLDHVHDAVAALEEYLRLDTGGTGRYAAGLLVQDLRSRLHQDVTVSGEAP